MPVSALCRNKKRKRFVLPTNILLLGGVLALWSCEKSPLTGTERDILGIEPTRPEEHSVEDSVEENRLEDQSFDIDLVFEDNGALNDSQKNEIELAAGRWESIIVGDLPDVSFVESPFDYSPPAIGTQFYVNDEVDDIRIFVNVGQWDSPILGKGGHLFARENSNLPALGAIVFNLNKIEEIDFYEIGMHEIAHCLGFNSVIWEMKNLIEFANADTHFIGIEAESYFDSLGGMDYPGAKVPLEFDGSHWRESVFRIELMDSKNNSSKSYLSAITIAAMRDIGYQVDYGQADSFSLPRFTAKPLASAFRGIRCEVITPVPGQSVGQ